MSQREPGDDAPGVRVEERGALAGEVGQHDETVRAGRGELRLLGERGDVDLPGELLDPGEQAP